MALETTVTVAQIRIRAGLRIGTGPGQFPDEAALDAEADRLLRLALAALEEALTGAFRTPTGDVVDDMVLIVAKGYADRSRVTGTNAQTTTADDGAGRPISRDPLAGVRTTLARYTVGLA